MGSRVSPVEQKGAKNDAEIQAKKVAEIQAKKVAKIQAKKVAKIQAKMDDEIQGKKNAEIQHPSLLGLCIPLCLDPGSGTKKSRDLTSPKVPGHEN